MRTLNFEKGTNEQTRHDSADVVMAVRLLKPQAVKSLIKVHLILLIVTLSVIIKFLESS